jgi:hypothetical protein
MLGENIIQSLQKLITIAQRLDELSVKVEKLDTSVNARLDKQDDRLRALEIAIGRLEESRATQRETVRAEIATAVAELRVRFAEEQRQRG